MADAAPKLRIDKWLWHARFFKTRTLAAAQVKAGVRVNGSPVSKPSSTVSPGDVITFSQARDVRVIQIDALGERRGPAPDAQALYTDLQPPEPKPKKVPNPGFDGKGRPTKRDRRSYDQSQARSLE